MGTMASLSAIAAILGIAFVGPPYLPAVFASPQWKFSPYIRLINGNQTLRLSFKRPYSLKKLPYLHNQQKKIVRVQPLVAF